MTMDENKSKPKVSVCVMTYNQEPYIGQCLQSIVDQQTAFPFEVIVGDDCSQDSTGEIIRSFERKYPQQVKPIFQSSNTGAMGNYLAVHRAAVGEYVCHIDGDDWMRPNKLALQHDFLENNQEYSLVAHRMGLWNSEDLSSVTRMNPETIDLAILLRNHPMFLHSSIMYRRSRIEDIFRRDDPFIDFYVYVSAALTGRIGFLNEVLGDYRQNIGISSTRNLMPYIQAAIDHAQNNGGNISDVRRSRSRSYLSYGVAALCQSDLKVFRSHLAASVDADPTWIYPKLIQTAGFMPHMLRRMVLLYKSRPQPKC